MANFASLNKQAGFSFKVKTEGFTFENLRDLEEGKTYPVKGVFINTKSKFGAKPVIISDGFMVDIPKHKMDDVNAILADHSLCEAIDAGQCAFTVRSYQDKTYGKCYTVDWVDVQ